MANGGLQLNVKHKTREVHAYLSKVSKDGQRAATRQAINRAMAQAKTAANKSIREHRTLKAKEVRKRIKDTKANYRTLTARITFNKQSIPMKEFKHGSKFVKGRRKNRWGARLRQVWVSIDKGKKEIVEGAFIGKSGHILKRQRGPGGKRVAQYPLKVVYGPSVASEFLKQRVLRDINRVADDAFDREFRAAMNRQIDKAARKHSR